MNKNVKWSIHSNLHRYDVFSAPTAHLERVEVKETRKCGDGFFGVEGRREGEREGLKTGAGVEDGEDEVGGGESPCGTERKFGADGEGSDVRAVCGRDMANEGVE